MSRHHSIPRPLQYVALAALTAIALVLVVMAFTRTTPHGSGANDRPSPGVSATDAPPQLRTVFVGDSITAADTPGFDSGSGAGSWVRYARADEKSPWAELANVGVGGETTTSMRDRFAADALSRNPEAVVIMAGTNDVSQGVPVETTLDNIEAMVTAAREAGSEVWLISAPPSNENGEGVRALTDAERNLAAQLGVPFIDVFSDLAQPDGSWPEGYTEDGTHPTLAGAQALAAAVIDGL